MTFVKHLCLIFFISLQLCSLAAVAKQIKIGSRDFPESILVAEIISSAIEKYSDYEVDRKYHLGGVKVCLSAMESKNLDIYPDYTGSLLHNVLGEHDSQAYLLNYLKDSLNTKYNFSISDSLGFDNSFVLVVHRDFANKYNLKNLSDLKELLNKKPELEKELNVAFKHSFIKRPDGYRELQRVYGFDFKKLNAMEYNIALQNLLKGKLDIIDSFSTDSRLKNSKLLVLEDDRHALIPYNAVYVARNELDQHFPELKTIIASLEASLDSSKMLELNERIEKGETYKSVAIDFLNSLELNQENLQNTSKRRKQTRIEQDLPLLFKALWQHIVLSFVATILACIFGLVLGILISYNKALAKIVLGINSIIQTIPSLALLALLIPLVGLGFAPAMLALFIYALLPIVQNTYSGIKNIDPEYIELGKSLALQELDILFKIKLAMAKPLIIAGIRTSAVICIGTATLATFVGGGGLGDLIKAGIDLNSNYMICLGALPAALLALFISLIFSRIEKA